MTYYVIIAITTIHWARAFAVKKLLGVVDRYDRRKTFICSIHGPHQTLEAKIRHFFPIFDILTTLGPRYHAQISKFGHFYVENDNNNKLELSRAHTLHALCV